MFTNNDERNGLVKTNWASVRERVAKVEPKFAKLIDAISPDASFVLYLAYYPYGTLTGDEFSPFLPNSKGDTYRLTQQETPRDVFKYLGYGFDGLPLTMILEKQVELYINLEKSKITIPQYLLKPGTLTPFCRILSYGKRFIYTPSNILSSAAGCRSAFVLANVGCQKYHRNLQHQFKVSRQAPKNLYDHWDIFREICLNEKQNDWRCCLLLFSEKWVKHLTTDPAWSDLKKYLLELSWNHYEYERNKIYYDIFFSMTQKKYNLKPNPYHIDTVKHLFAIALGVAPGFSPAINDSALPDALLESAYTNYYGLSQYCSSIMIPNHFSFGDQYPVYYSLQNPSNYVFSPKSREITNTLLEMKELQRILKIFIKELLNEKSFYPEIILNHIAKNVDFNFYHNRHDKNQIIFPSSEISKTDSRFLLKAKHGTKFPEDAQFLRGCVSISYKQNNL